MSFIMLNEINLKPWTCEWGGKVWGKNLVQSTSWKLHMKQAGCILKKVRILKTCLVDTMDVLELHFGKVLS